MRKDTARDVFDILLFDSEQTMVELIRRNARYILEYPTMYNLSEEQKHLLRTIVQRPRVFAEWVLRNTHSANIDHITVQMMQQYIENAQMHLE